MRNVMQKCVIRIGCMECKQYLHHSQTMQIANATAVPKALLRYVICTVANVFGSCSDVWHFAGYLPPRARHFSSHATMYQ